MNKAALTIFYLLTFLSPPLWGWWDTGHMAIAQIAYDRLSLEAREKANEWVSIIGDEFPESNDFITSACWVGDLQAEHSPLFYSWESVAVQYDPEKVTHKNNLIENKSGLAIAQCHQTLANPATGQWAKAFALRLLVHLVGELHQPLQCTSLVNQEFPQGDGRGTLFTIQGNRPINHLHNLWESLFGLALPRLPRPLSEENHHFIRLIAKQTTEEFPYEKLEELRHQNVDEWITESVETAQTVAYQGITPNDLPSKEYIEEGRRASFRRIALAGYRLADLLNDAVLD